MKTYYIGQKLYPELEIEEQERIEKILKEKYKIEIGFFTNELDSMSISTTDDNYYNQISTSPGDLSLFRNGCRVLTLVNTFGRIDFYGIGDNLLELKPILTIPLLEEYDFKLD